MVPNSANFNMDAIHICSGKNTLLCRYGVMAVLRQWAKIDGASVLMWSPKGMTRGVALRRTFAPLENKHVEVSVHVPPTLPSIGVP